MFWYLVDERIETTPKTTQAFRLFVFGYNCPFSCAFYLYKLKLSIFFIFFPAVNLPFQCGYICVFQLVLVAAILAVAFAAPQYLAGAYPYAAPVASGYPIPAPYSIYSHSIAEHVEPVEQWGYKIAF